MSHSRFPLLFMLMIIVLAFFACTEDDDFSSETDGDQLGEDGDVNWIESCRLACARQDECLAAFANTSATEEDGDVDSICLQRCIAGEYGQDFPDCVLSASCSGIQQCLQNIPLVDGDERIQDGDGVVDADGDLSIVDGDAPASCSGECGDTVQTFCIDGVLCACLDGNWTQTDCVDWCEDLEQDFAYCGLNAGSGLNQCFCEDPLPVQCSGSCDNEGRKFCFDDWNLCSCTQGEWSLVDCAAYCQTEETAPQPLCFDDLYNSVYCDCSSPR